MKYGDFLARDAFDPGELRAFADGRLVDDPPAAFRARLPSPPLLMLDRILEIRRAGGRGRIVAEQDVRPDAWFFGCHFRGDPVQPGCLGLDAVWQLVGFFCAWSGGLGAGRALGVGEVEFAGEIRPGNTVVRHEVDVVRFSLRPATGLSVAVADARVLVDGEAVYEIRRARAGTFPDVGGAESGAAARSRGRTEA